MTPGQRRKHKQARRKYDQHTVEATIAQFDLAVPVAALQPTKLNKDSHVHH